MYSKPFIINNSGKIFIFPKNIDFDEQKLQQVESKLRQFTSTINYSEQIHEFDFDIYSIWSLIIMGEEMLDDFISFLKDNSVNEFPKNLYNTIQTQKENFKQVLLEENLENIIITVLHGHLDSIIKKHLEKEVQYDMTKKIYTSNKTNSLKITKTLLKNDVSIKLDNYLETVKSINLDFKCTFNLRYYESEALSLILNKGQENGIIFMPPGSGKSYVSLKLVEHFKVSTLILCDNSEEYWKNFIESNTINMDENIVSIYNDNNRLTPITICSYQKAKDTVLSTLSEYPWGIIFYDDAHRALANKYSKTLYIKSKFKFALAATLSRNDGKGRQLYDIIGPKIYNIEWQELKLRRFYKHINYTMVISKQYSKLSICKKIVNSNKNKNILICSFNLEEGEQISKLLNIPNLNGEGNDYTKKIKEREIINKFIKCDINIICVSSILQRLQISNIDVLIALTHNKGSKTEEIFRIGRAASCSDQTDVPCTTEFYSIVIEKEKIYFSKRLSSVIKYIPTHNIINDTTIMDGDY